jgi:hypothetical protein
MQFDGFSFQIVKHPNFDAAYVELRQHNGITAVSTFAFLISYRTKRVSNTQKMDATSSRLRYGFILCVWLVICRIIWDVGLMTKQGTLKKYNLEELIAFAPTITTASATATTNDDRHHSEKKRAIHEGHLVQSNTTLTAEQEAQLKNLIDFTLGDEIERESLAPGEIQELLNVAIAEAQESFAKLSRRSR